MEGQKEQNGRTGQKEHVRLEFESCSKNEEFARVVAAVFMSRLDPTLEETQDVKQQCQRQSPMPLSMVMEKRPRDIFGHDG